MGRHTAAAWAPLPAMCGSAREAEAPPACLPVRQWPPARRRCRISEGRRQGLVRPVLGARRDREGRGWHQ